MPASQNRAFRYLSRGTRLAASRCSNVEKDQRRTHRMGERAARLEARRSSAMRSKSAAFDTEVDEAQEPRDFAASSRDSRIIESELRDVKCQLDQAHNRNEKLVNALYEAREQITALKEEVDKLCAPPSTYGVYLSVNEDGTVNILSQGRKVKVNLHPSLKVETLEPGQELVLNEALNVVDAAGYEIQGEVVILKEQLDEERAVVTLRADEEKVGIIADP